MPRPHVNDLFALFPDLPWSRLRTASEQMAAVQKNVRDMRQRAQANIQRQRHETERVRASISTRRRR